MTLDVTAISPAAANRHEHIADLRWLDSGNSTSKTMPVARAVKWLCENPAREMVVAGQDGPVKVQVVEANPPYLRTAANQEYTDNLLSLPRY